MTNDEYDEDDKNVRHIHLNHCIFLMTNDEYVYQSVPSQKCLFLTMRERTRNVQKDRQKDPNNLFPPFVKIDLCLVLTTQSSVVE